ncbi:hypothetical protein FACS1894182_13590 [Bacteroidia bacterium]|nr:hypothetical protein FACS1894182_13590 [Bacteroidia bacterium]
MKKYFIFLLWVFPLIITAQNGNKYSFPGPYNGAASQGMAVYKNSLFLLNNGGHCRIYDLKSEELVSDFDLGSADKNNHCNSASFGVEFPKGNKEFPAFYVAECYGERRCFVESVTRNGSQLIQVLRIETEGKESNSFDWVVDREQKYLYALARISDEIDSIGTKKYLITKLPLPSLDKKEVVFTKEDFIEQFEIAFPNLSQGASIRKNYMYLPVGLHTSPSIGTRKDAHRDIIVVNLKTKRIEKTIDIQNIVDGEPEDVDFYQNNLILYCGQKDGGVYNLRKIYR